MKNSFKTELVRWSFQGLENLTPRFPRGLTFGRMFSKGWKNIFPQTRDEIERGRRVAVATTNGSGNNQFKAFQIILPSIILQKYTRSVLVFFAKKSRSSIVVLVMLMAGCTPAEQASVWYGPATLNTVTRGIRDDFMSQFTDTNNWPTVYQQTAVFKQFIETLSGNKYSDDELKELATFTQEAGLKCAFEIGALRWSPKLYGAGSGEKYAAQEIKVLQRWIDAGGTVDYLTTDHAVMWNVGLCLQGAKPMAGIGDPDWHKVMDEVVDSLSMIHGAFPNAKIGMIESLGYFSVGEQYTTTDPQCIYPLDFKEFFATAQSRLKERGIELDHVHIDFSYQDCRYDGRREKRMDFGRIMAAEKRVQSLGLDSGIIINAYDDFSYVVMGGSNTVQEKEKAQNAAERSVSAVDNTLEYFDQYVAAGGNPDAWIFQRWQPYPDVTGPETVLESDMGIAKELLNRLNRVQK